MKHPVIVRHLAEQDLLEAQEWYEEMRPELGGEFLSTIDRLLRRISDGPLAYPLVHCETRRAVVRRFPFVLYFRVLSDSVIVLACLNGKRGPAVVKSRLLSSQRPES